MKRSKGKTIAVYRNFGYAKSVDDESLTYPFELTTAMITKQETGIRFSFAKVVTFERATQ